jgi:hypothetical protein
MTGMKNPAGRSQRDPSRRTASVATFKTSAGRASAVGRFGFDVPGRQVLGREILEVRGDDDLRTGPDRRSQHVPIIQSGSFSPSMRDSYPSTRQSRTAEFMRERSLTSFSSEMSGRLATRLRCTSPSSRMGEDESKQDHGLARQDQWVLSAVLDGNRDGGLLRIAHEIVLNPAHGSAGHLSVDCPWLDTLSLNVGHCGTRLPQYPQQTKQTQAGMRLSIISGRHASGDSEHRVPPTRALALDQGRQAGRSMAGGARKGYASPVVRPTGQATPVPPIP